MYTDNYGNSTKYIYMYMIVLDYIHTQRDTGHKIKE